MPPFSSFSSRTLPALSVNLRPPPPPPRRQRPCLSSYNIAALQLKPDTRLAKTENNCLPTATVRGSRYFLGIDTPLKNCRGHDPPPPRSPAPIVVCHWNFVTEVGHPPGGKENHALARTCDPLLASLVLYRRSSLLPSRARIDFVFISVVPFWTENCIKLFLNVMLSTE